MRETVGAALAKEIAMSNRRSSVPFFAFALLLYASYASAQLAPTGSHYAARSSDTGFSGVSDGGAASLTVPLEVPPSRGGLPVPIKIVAGGRSFGAAGVGWDVPLSYVQVDRSFVHRRPTLATGVFPGPRERVSVRLPGRVVELVPEAGRWLGRNAPDVSATLENGGWNVLDGSGLTYTFIQHPFLVGTGGPFPGAAGLWLLDSIKGPNGATVVLFYDIQQHQQTGSPPPSVSISPIPSVSIDLVRLKYNPHPSAGCFKHEVGLSYDASTVGAPPKSLAVVGDRVLSRHRKLVTVDITARADCTSEPERQRLYMLHYVPDPDTQQDRLASVEMFGRTGTPEAATSVPVGSFRYGSASSVGTAGGNALRYQATSPLAVLLPQGADVIGDTTKVTNGLFQSPIAGSTSSYVTQNNLIDMTGDGRPDLVFEKNGMLMIARNVPDASGSTTFAVPVALTDSVLSTPYLEARSSRVDRFYGAATTVNTDYVWRQMIDVNGDGRMDLIDAAEKPGVWTIYLNTPGVGPSGITWVVRLYDVQSIYQRLAAAGMAVSAGYVPLSRRFTGRDHDEWMCWRTSNTGYVPYPIGLPPPEGLGTVPNCAGTTQPLWSDVEKTFIEWEVKDINGDGYPDFVYNSSPATTVAGSPPINYSGDFILSPQRFVIRLAGEQGGHPNRVYGLLNVRGVFIPGPGSLNETAPFSAPVELISNDECGVGRWSGYRPTTIELQTLSCGLLDVNGDGIADRIQDTYVYIGTGVGFQTSRIRLPAQLTQQSGHLGDCEPPNINHPWSYALQLSTLRDVTGDGVPDFLYHDGGFKVYAGTGAGFSGTSSGTVYPGQRLDVEGTFAISQADEKCDGTESRTISGLYDLDGDGKPEYVALSNVGAWHLEAYRLFGGSTWGNPEAGRIIETNNGYGAITKFSYRSAKQDPMTIHQVPFSEVVVSRTETTAGLGHGGSLVATEHAYGNIDLFYDSTTDVFRPTGYLRHVERTKTSDTGYPALQVAVSIVDRYSLDSVTTTALAAMNDPLRYGRYLRAGQPKRTTVLAGAIDADAWALLGTDVDTDARRISQTVYDVSISDTHMFNASSSTSGEPCFDITFPYDFDLSKQFNQSHYNTCTVRGFLVANSALSWRGTSAPPSGANVQVAWDRRVVDDLGRTTSVRLRNDLSRLDDDVCVDTSYASPTLPNEPIVGATSSRKLWAGPGCSEGLASSTVFAEEGWEYDNLYPGLVTHASPTAHTIYRHAADTGAYLGTVREYDAVYDALGNPSRIEKHREDGAARTVTFAYDPFGLAMTQTSVGGTNVPTQTTFQLLDPVTGDALGSKDENGVVRSVTVDGFGRPILEQVEAADVVGVISATSYIGFDGNSADGRRVEVKQFTDPVDKSVIATAEARTITTFLDELGRVRFRRVALGDDYANEELVADERAYDPTGRLAFEADPYPAKQGAGSAYGTTRYFDKFGTPWAEIRGRGRQVFDASPDPAVERYPTLFTHSFSNHTEVLASQTADALTVGSLQYGVSRESVATAIGRVITRSTWQNGNRLEHAAFEHDRLGQQNKVIRYLNTAQPSGAVEWSSQFDSIGQLIRLAEPSTAVQERTYSDWGELKKITSMPPWPDSIRTIIQVYDSLGRLTHSEEQTGGATDSESIKDFRYDVPAQLPLIDPTNVVGRLASASSPAGVIALSYDAFGRVNGRNFTDEAKIDFVERQQFHADGSLASIELNLPDTKYKPERVDYSYDTAGAVRSMWYTDGTNTEDLFDATQVDVWGRLRLATFGKKTVLRANYADVGRRLPLDVKVEAGLNSRSVVFNTFDAVGRETARTEGAPSAGNRVHTYDALGRARSSNWIQTGTPLGQWTYAYDPLGNVVSVSEGVSNSTVQMSYDTADRDRICRIAYSGVMNSTCNVEYDNLGNVILEPTRTGYNKLRYFNLGNVRSIENEAGTKATFRYDAFDQVQALDIRASDGELLRSDRHVGDFVTQRSQSRNKQSVSYLARQFPGPGLVMSRRGTGGPWVYQFSESRGTRITTDQEGNFVQDFSYAPYGETSSTGAAAATATFTTEQWNDGQSLDGFGSLVHVGARIYDPVIGRFLSRDPLLIPRTSATSNPYAFAFNDPVNFSDPTGLDPCADNPDCALGAAAMAGVIAATAYYLFGSDGSAALPDHPSRIQEKAYYTAYSIRLDDLRSGTLEGIREELEPASALFTVLNTGAHMVGGAAVPAVNALGTQYVRAHLATRSWSWEKQLWFAGMNAPVFGNMFSAGMQARAGNYGAAGIHAALGVAEIGLGGMISGARSASTGITRALPAGRQIEAAWGASTYRHGGLMTGIEHIMYRHSANSGFANVSRFAAGTTARNVVSYVDDALRYGMVARNGTGYVIEHNLAKIIGTNIAGANATSIRVFVRDGIIQSAFPF